MIPAATTTVSKTITRETNNLRRIESPFLVLMKQHQFNKQDLANLLNLVSLVNRLIMINIKKDNITQTPMSTVPILILNSMGLDL